MGVPNDERRAVSGRVGKRKVYFKRWLIKLEGETRTELLSQHLATKTPVPDAQPGAWDCPWPLEQKEGSEGCT